MVLIQGDIQQIVWKLRCEIELFMQDKDMWNLKKNAQGIKIYGAPSRHYHGMVIKGETKMCMSPEKVYDMIHPTSEYRFMWDAHVDKCEFLQELGPGLVLLHQVMRPSFMGCFSSRDTIDFMLQEESDSKRICLVHSLESSDLPPTPKHVRAFTYPSGMIIEKTECKSQSTYCYRNANESQITCFLQVKMNAKSIPQSIIDSSLMSMMQSYLLALRKAKDIAWKPLEKPIGRIRVIMNIRFRMNCSFYHQTVSPTLHIMDQFIEQNPVDERTSKARCDVLEMISCYQENSTEEKIKKMLKKSVDNNRQLVIDMQLILQNSYNLTNLYHTCEIGLRGQTMTKFCINFAMLSPDPFNSNDQLVKCESPCPKNTSQTEIRVERVSHQWTVKNFTHCYQEYLEYFVRLPRPDESLTWSIKIYPKGNGENNKEFIFLCLNRVVPLQSKLSKIGFKSRFIMRNAERKEIEMRVHPSPSHSDYVSYIKRDVLYPQILPHDVIIVTVEIDVAVEIVTTSNEDNFSYTDSIKHFINDSEAMLKSHTFSDFEIEVGGRIIPAHRCMLAARSTVFAAMLTHQTHETQMGRLVIPDFDFEVISELVRFIYTGRCRRLKELSHDLLVVADKYRVLDLKIRCERVLANSLTVENACDLLVIADTHSASYLKEKALDFMHQNVSQITTTQGWTLLLNQRQELVTEVVQSFGKDVQENMMELWKEEIASARMQKLKLSQPYRPQSYKLVELPENLLAQVKSGQKLYIRGKPNDKAYISVSNETYELVEQNHAGSSTFLICENLQVPTCKQNDEQQPQDSTICTMISSILTTNYCYIPCGKMIRRLLNDDIYDGLGKSTSKQQWTVDKLLLAIPSNEQQLCDALKQLHVCEIDGFLRLLSVNYLINLTDRIVREIRANNLNTISVEEAAADLEELGLISVIESWFKWFTVANDDGQGWHLNEKEISRLYAEGLLSTVESMELKQFLDAWKESVPVEIETQLNYLYGIALIRDNTSPEVIEYFPSYDLPADRNEQIKLMFEKKRIWKLEQLRPYFPTNNDAQIHTILEKHCRCYNDDVQSHLSFNSMHIGF
ncbi:Protein maternal effect lethal 26 [Trichinella patagoniensis]|uniref:Protein maternal effect lethal 26 n=1 Tax=Trichinella patagoniensis TaxID=990121 RepID=A0A0V0ZK10_9BILA|nr:Protein maternal effect lethal 26 [Trichinella patagoniensis]